MPIYKVNADQKYLRATKDIVGTIQMSGENSIIENSAIKVVDFRVSDEALRVSYWDKTQPHNIQEVFLSLGSDNDIVFVPQEKLPTDDLLYLVNKTGLRPEFNKFCDTIAFCSSIKALEKDSTEWIKLAGLSVFKEPEALNEALGTRITPLTMFISSSYNGHLRNICDILITIGHELAHHEFLYRARHGNERLLKSPDPVTHFYCTYKERVTAMGLKDHMMDRFTDQGGLNPIFGIPSLQSYINIELQNINNTMKSLYDKSDKQAFSEAINMDVKDIDKLEPFQKINIELR